MGWIEVLAGDVKKCAWHVETTFSGGIDSMVRIGEVINLRTNLERVELHNEESIKKLGGTAGWGLAGFAVARPLGAIGGMLIGGRGKNVLFAAYLRDGRKFLAKTDGKTWEKLAAITFG